MIQEVYEKKSLNQRRKDILEGMEVKKSKRKRERATSAMSAKNLDILKPTIPTQKRLQKIQENDNDGLIEE